MSGSLNRHRWLRYHYIRDIVHVNHNDARPYLFDLAGEREHASFNGEAKYGSFFPSFWTKHSFQSDNILYTWENSKQDAHSECVGALVDVADDTCHKNSRWGVEHRGMWLQQLFNCDELKTKSEKVQ